MANRVGIRRRVLVGAIAAIIVVAAASSAIAVSGGSGTSYRFATVGRGSVAQSIVTTGAISPISAADVDFQVSGTVGRVLVKQGQRVKAGQQLARLDRTSLRSTLTSAESTLTAARSTLANDESSQSASSSASTPTSTDGTGTSPTVTATPTPTAGSTTTPGGGSTTGGSSRLARDQATLLAAQRRADQDLTTAKAALAAETTACASEVSPSPSPTATSTTATTATTATAATTSTQTCTDATKALLADQETVSADQSAVATAEQALNADLATAGRSTSPTGSGTTSQTTARKTAAAAATTPTSQQPSNSSTSDGSTQATATMTVTAAQLAADQATIDNDRAAVATARASLAQAVVTSPISGRVVAVTISQGDTVSGSSSPTSPAIEIVGSKQSQVTIDLTAAQVRLVSKGMTAHVVADGTSSTVSGTVTSVGLTTGSSDSTTYPVVIALSARATALVSGADAAVTLDLATVDNVVSVPTSAVHRSGTKTYVEVVKNGKLTHDAVTVGAVGPTLTQIRSGVTAGQRIVLADLNAAVPSSSTNLTRTGSGLTRGGFGGGGLGGSGGFPGGAGFSGGPPTVGGGG